MFEDFQYMLISNGTDKRIELERGSSMTQCLQNIVAALLVCMLEDVRTQVGEKMRGNSLE